MEKTKLDALLISADTAIKPVMQKLNITGGKIVFVTDENRKLLGTVTDGDIRRGITNGLNFTAAVKEIMKTKFISINKNSPDIHKKAKELMQEHKIEYVPIVNGKGEITDVISWADYFDSESLSQEAVNFLQNPVIIMAGGKGTRLDPFTKILPKPLIPLGDKPIIEHIMGRFQKRGFNKFKIIINYKKEMIKIYFSDNNLRYDIEFTEEKDYYGTSGGLFLLKSKLTDTFFVTNCDTILEGDYMDFLNWHKEKNNLLTIIGSHREILVPYGVLNMSNSSLVSINEKPKIDLFINTGTYIFEPEVLDFISENEYVDMDKLIERVKGRHNDKIGVYPHWGGWFDTGQWGEYRDSLKQFGEDIEHV